MNPTEFQKIRHRLVGGYFFILIANANKQGFYLKVCEVDDSSLTGISASGELIILDSSAILSCRGLRFSEIEKFKLFAKNAEVLSRKRERENENSGF